MSEAASAAANWLGRRVFITGHTGFKGGWLAWMLARRGARLSGYAWAAPSPAGSPSLYHAAQVASAFEREHVADVRDAEALTAALHAAQPEVVFHLAAQPLVRTSYADPLHTFATNVMGTAHVLQAVRQCASVRAVVVVTSDKCYRDLGPPCHEGDALGGHDPYSASKACAEIVTASFMQAYELPQRGVGVATVRAGNVIGGGDWSEDRLVPDVLRAIDACRAPELRNPDAVRPWQHVLDPLAGYVRLAERLLEAPQALSGAWNFGPDEADALPVATVAQRLIDLAREQGLSAGDVRAMNGQLQQLHEAAVLRLDSAKARDELAWAPRLTLPAALEASWRWHQAWRSQADMRNTTLRQINDHAASSTFNA